MSRLEGRVIAVAGAAGGLGPAVVAALAREGAMLALTDVNQERLAGVAQGAGLDDRHDYRVVNLLDQEATTDWASSLQQRFGHVDGLAHLVGGWRGGQPLWEASLEDYAWLHDLLVRTVQHTTRAFAPLLSAAGAKGRFVLVSSSVAQQPTNTNAAYAATKSAAEAWTLALADGLKPSGATANIIVVTALVTPRMREEKPDSTFPNFTPVEDVAEAMVFLCSDAAQKMNGQRLALHRR